jgi:hypothetical protein
MAHYIAELILAADAAPSNQEAQAQVATAILDLWRHRADAPFNRQPLETFEAIARALARLDPGRPSNEFYDSRSSRSAGAPIVGNLADIAAALERTSKDAIRSLLEQATRTAEAVESDWLADASGIDDDPSVDLIIASLGNGGDPLRGVERTIDAISACVDALEAVRAHLQKHLPNTPD